MNRVLAVVLCGLLGADSGLCMATAAKVSGKAVAIETEVVHKDDLQQRYRELFDPNIFNTSPFEIRSNPSSSEPESPIEFLKVKEKLYQSNFTTLNQCQVSIIADISANPPNIQSVEFTPLNNNCRTGFWLFEFSNDQSELRITETNTRQSLFLKLNSSQTTLNAIYTDENGNQEISQFPYTRKTNHKKSLEKVFFISDIGDDIANSLRCDICRRMEDIQEIYFGIGKGGTVDDFLGTAASGFSGAIVAIANLILSGISQMDDFKLNCDRQPFCQSVAQEEEPEEISQETEPSETFDWGGCNQVPFSRPACSRSSKTCIYSAVSRDPFRDQCLGRIGGFRASCNASQDEVYQLIQSSFSQYDRSVLGGSLLLDRCVPDPDEEDDTTEVAQRKGDLRKGSSYGDPHLVSFDNFRYSFQTVGEFILAKSVGGDFEVQTRQGPIPGRDVSLNIGAAMQVEGDRVAFYSKFFPDSDTSTPLRVNGKPTRISRRPLSLPNGGTIYKQGGSNYLVKWPSGEEVAIRFIQMSGSDYMNVTPYVLSSPPGQFTGLLGNLNNDPSDDLRTRNGTPLLSHSSYGQVRDIVTRIVPIPGAIPLSQIENTFFNQLYKNFGNSWRISQSESLFDYASDQTTETFTDRSFPRRYKTMDMLSPQQIQQAEQTCLEAGVEPDLLEGCIFDVGFTGDRSFAQAAANALNIIDQFNDFIDLIPGGLRIPRPRLPIPIPGLPF